MPSDTTPVLDRPEPVDNMTSQEAAPSPTRRRRVRVETGGGLLARYGLFLLWGAMILLYIGVAPGFNQGGSAKVILSSQQPLVFLGLSLVVTFVVNEFDLSGASVMGLSATIVPVLVVNNGMGVVPACVIAIAVASCVGLVNGLLIVKVGIDGIVVTLGMATLLLGVALEISHLQAVVGLPQSFARIANESILGLPISFYYGLVGALLFAYVLAFTPLGRHLRFVGSNREVARLAGVRVSRIRVGSYVVGSTIAGVGGVILVAGAGGFNPPDAQLYLLPAVSAVFLGTAVFQPGRINPLGTFVAVYFLQTGIFGLQLMGGTGWVSQVFYGAALIIAVTVSTLARRSRAHEAR
jgi:ribose transport system permease protein